MLDSLLRVARLRMMAAATPAPTATPAPASAPAETIKTYIDAQGVSAGNYSITTYRNGTCKITRYRGAAAKVNIPGKLNGYCVTSIGRNAFDHCAAISITIPDSVTHIGDRAFSDCYILSSFTIPDSVTCIGLNTFASCQYLGFRVRSGSYAQQYAIENAIPYTIY